MAGRFPRKVFRVVYDQSGRPFVTERMMVSKNHSWYVTETQDGVQHKEHGNYWSDTVLEALQREAECIMHRFAVTSLFHPRDQIKAMDGLLVEAVEWGRLLGEVGVKREVLQERAERQV